MSFVSRKIWRRKSRNFVGRFGQNCALQHSSMLKLFEKVESIIRWTNFCHNAATKFLKSSKIEAASFEIPNFPNMIWLYRKFVATKIKIVQSEKGELVGQEKTYQEVDGVDMIFHHE